MKHPVKLATLRRESYFDPDVKGCIAFIDPQEVAYREAMGRPSPEPFEEGTVAHDQWKYRNRGHGDPDVLTHPRAKPRVKLRARRGRRPVGA